MGDAPMKSYQQFFAELKRRKVFRVMAGRARAAYAEFIERWRNADPRLQPMVDTARAALARLGPMDQ